MESGKEIDEVYAGPYLNHRVALLDSLAGVLRVHYPVLGIERGLEG